jgi:hypothetical protein
MFDEEFLLSTDDNMKNKNNSSNFKRIRSKDNDLTYLTKSLLSE